jgi:hypothetical protein
MKKFFLLIVVLFLVPFVFVVVGASKEDRSDYRQLEVEMPHVAILSCAEDLGPAYTFVLSVHGVLLEGTPRGEFNLTMSVAREVVEQATGQIQNGHGLQATFHDPTEVSAALESIRSSHLRVEISEVDSEEYCSRLGITDYRRHGGGEFTYKFPVLFVIRD